MDVVIQGTKPSKNLSKLKPVWKNGQNAIQGGTLPAVNTGRTVTR